MYIVGNIKLLYSDNAISISSYLLNKMLREVFS